jgi:hypothetical protein
MEARRSAVVRRRWLAVAALLAACSLLLAGAYRYLAPQGVSAHEMRLGPASQFPAQTVTYERAGHVYLVHFEGANFLALFERSPWNQAHHGVAPDECRVRWYLGPRDVTETTPDETSTTRFPMTNPGSGERDPIGDGFFRESCTGWTFDAHGAHLFGPDPALDRFRVFVSDGSVVVDTSSRVTAGSP